MSPQIHSIMRKPLILHTARYTGLPWDILKSIVPDSFEIKTLNELSYDCLLQQCVDADYLLVSGRLPIDEGVLSAAKHLKMIQRTGVGTEMLDMEAIKAHTIPVYVNAGVNAQSVAEHTLTLMLACLKRLPHINKQVHEGVWKKQQTGVTTHELRGKTVALVGMGNIGRMVAKMLQAFDAKVIYTDIVRQDEETEKRLGLSYYNSFEAMLPEADILSFHCPLTTANTEILNKRTISLMKKGAIVVNTARGKLINPDDLYEALASNRLVAAALDTHFEEPLPHNYPLAQLDNVILTPHIGGLSYEAFYTMMKEAVENIVAFEEQRIEEIQMKLVTK